MAKHNNITVVISTMKLTRYRLVKPEALCNGHQAYWSSNSWECSMFFEEDRRFSMKLGWGCVCFVYV